jgi:hypothetical protein
MTAITNDPPNTYLAVVRGAVSKEEHDQFIAHMKNVFKDSMKYLEELPTAQSPPFKVVTGDTVLMCPYIEDIEEWEVAWKATKKALGIRRSMMCDLSNFELSAWIWQRFVTIYFQRAPDESIEQFAKNLR